MLLTLGENRRISIALRHSCRIVFSELQYLIIGEIDMPQMF